MRALLHRGWAANLILGALISSGTIARSQQPPPPQGLKLGEAAPDFALSNIEGKRVQLNDYRGKKHVALVFYPALFRAGG